MSTSRRIPPPCWSDDETAALIQVYRDKWYSLRRGNLRAADWQDLADAVAGRCTLANPPKTAVQCRHKMEKLRKRYRTEVQRIGNIQKRDRDRDRVRVRVSWVHFKLMDSMELGTFCDEDEDDLSLRRGNGFGTGVRISVPVRTPVDLTTRSIDYLSGTGSGIGSGNDGNVLAEMVGAIRKLGDGFVKMERMKMEKVREVETMRMEMEIEQTGMVLAMQRKMWDAFVETVEEKEKKKMKRMPKISVPKL